MNSIITAITGVFDNMGSWITGSIPDITAIFYDAAQGSLTFVGVLAVASLGISVFFLIMGLVQNFLHFRG